MVLRGVRGWKRSEKIAKLCDAYEPGVAQQSQMEAGHRGNWSAALDAGTQTTGWGLPLSSSLDLIGFPPEMFISFTAPLRSSSPTYLITIY